MILLLTMFMSHCDSYIWHWCYINYADVLQLHCLCQEVCCHDNWSLNRRNCSGLSETSVSARQKTVLCLKLNASVSLQAVWGGFVLFCSKDNLVFAMLKERCIPALFGKSQKQADFMTNTESQWKGSSVDSAAAVWWSQAHEHVTIKCVFVAGYYLAL